MKKFRERKSQNSTEKTGSDFLQVNSSYFDKYQRDFRKEQSQLNNLISQEYDMRKDIIQQHSSQSTQNQSDSYRRPHDEEEETESDSIAYQPIRQNHLRNYESISHDIVADQSSQYVNTTAKEPSPISPNHDSSCMFNPKGSQNNFAQFVSDFDKPDLYPNQRPREMPSIPLRIPHNSFENSRLVPPSMPNSQEYSSYHDLDSRINKVHEQFPTFRDNQNQTFVSEEEVSKNEGRQFDESILNLHVP